MARQESDRDDLFAELAALSPRVEMQVSDSGDAVCAGRRDSTGGWSVYLRADQVYHFDSAGRLRRAYVDGFLYRSDGGTLARLRRERSTTETVLLRHDLDAAELHEFLVAMHSAIGGLLRQIQTDSVAVLRVVPGEEDVVSSLVAALEQALATVQLADGRAAPPVDG